ncbi:uncharacterized protein DNG_07496 [Cephalotrichum gorgonifer]|uniref:Glycosyltransferase family 69 protein n=1 Tax=Cephalotrichum gorgonifer TaxID=2041049 RepID=A0AAE8N1R2_9PEZI|nr:uncharacterized protein DNG_07496 [Cephalotrichum gorgonifer]
MSRTAVMDDSDDTLDSLSNEPEAPLLPIAKQPHVPRPKAVARWLVRRPLGILRWARRHPRAFFLRLLLYILYALLALLVITPVVFPSYHSPPARYSDLRARCRAADDGCANPRIEKVFIAVSLYDPDGSLAGGAWGRAVVDLITVLGEDNVFLSIYENDSGEDGQRALRELEARVRSRKSIVADMEPVRYEEYPHVTMPGGERVLKRLAYLTEVRNRAFKPIDRFRPPSGNGTDSSNGGGEDAVMEFDKVLFLSDALFDPIDAANLLFSTNADESGRARYLSACAVDYNQNPLLFYDLYAQRDSEGYSNGVPLFPYFPAEGSAESRRAMLSETDAVPVKSCWGGMVAAQAAHFQNLEEEIPHPDWYRPAHHVVDPESPRNASAPVRFRYEPEVFFDACECCLLQADLRTVAEGSSDPHAETGVFVNPYVRVAYSERVLSLVPVVMRFERLFAPVQRLAGALAGLPTRNPHRTVRQGETFLEEVFNSKGEWEVVQRTGRNGMFCGVREMQTIVMGKREEGGKGEGLVNWVSWDVPWRDQQFDFPT